MRPAWLDRYLERLGIAHPGPPSAESLFALHRAHVERVAFETIDMQLGRPPGIDPEESIGRIIAGRGGYCFHLNGAFATLLGALGYQVTWHRGAVHGAWDSPRPADYGNHLAITVDLEGRTWMADTGLGNALYEPIPLREGVHRQGPFRFRLERNPTVPDGWRFIHDPALRSFHGMDFTLRPAALSDFAPYHAELSSSPSSSFVKICQVYRRDAGGVDSLLGCVLRRDEGNGRPARRELTSAADWLAAASEVFGLRLGRLSPADREMLWQRVRRAHRPAVAAPS
jgi:N-hydroxyarylamine O-acetyltransferase